MQTLKKKENQAFWLRLAGLPVCLEPDYEYMKQFSKDYLIAPEPEDRKLYTEWMNCAGFTGEQPIRVSQQERDREAQAAPSRITSGQDGYLESLALYRKICERMLCRDRLLFHCSALALDGEAYLFTAPSGTGKSTHARLWRQYFGDRVVMINDDKPLLSVQDGQITVYGTPFAGKDCLQTNTSAAVKGIIVLHQAKENTIRRLSVEAAYPLLFNQTYRDYNNEESMLRTMELVHRLARLPVFSLGCTISEEAVHLAYQMCSDSV